MLHPLHLKMLDHNSYKKSKIKKSISGTSFLKPTQKIILNSRFKPEIEPEKKISSSIGTAIHLAYEISIEEGYEFEFEGNNYKVLGKEVSMSLPVGDTGFHATGTADLVLLKNDQFIHIQDIKTCKDWIFKNKAYSKWIKQLSIYSLLAKHHFKKEIDTKGTILYYNKTKEAKSDVSLGHKIFDLLSINETKKLMMDKTLDVIKYWDLPDDELHKLPKCTKEEQRLCSWCGHILDCQQMNPFKNGNYDF